MTISMCVNYDYDKAARVRKYMNGPSFPWSAANERLQISYFFPYGVRQDPYRFQTINKCLQEKSRFLDGLNILAASCLAGWQ